MGYQGIKPRLIVCKARILPAIVWLLLQIYKLFLRLSSSSGRQWQDLMIGRIQQTKVIGGSGGNTMVRTHARPELDSQYYMIPSSTISFTQLVENPEHHLGTPPSLISSQLA